jgi:hypothetical protein
MSRSFATLRISAADSRSPLGSLTPAKRLNVKPRGVPAK